jgi:hypothetical protein
MPPITMLLTTFTCASPPRKWPTMAVANRLSLSVRPPPIIRLPASRNSGIAISGKLSAPVTMRCGSTISGTLPQRQQGGPGAHHHRERDRHADGEQEQGAPEQQVGHATLPSPGLRASASLPCARSSVRSTW